MRATVCGTGAVGGRAARQLASSDGFDDVVLMDADAGAVQRVAASLGPGSRVAPTGDDLAGADVVVLATPVGHRRLAERALEQGAHVVSVADGVGEVRALLDLDAEARERGLSVVVGAGFAPGLSCVLARHAAARFDAVDEVHVARAGTGGPACARQHHRSLGGEAVDWRDGVWSRGRSGSGRELCWFPDPVGGRDCYRAAMPDAYLLAPAFAGLSRVTARTAASRRDRLTARLPMLRRPHPEGDIGGVWVEVRGRRGTAHEVQVLGAVDRPALAAGAVAAVAALWAVSGRLAGGGAGGLAQLLVDAGPFLGELARRGVKAAVFEGAGARSGGG